MHLDGMRFDEIAVGYSAEFDVDVSAADIEDFVRLSGDRSPIHVDDGAARQAGFTGRVVHGFLIGVHVSRLVGMELPGCSGLLLSEELRFHKPVHEGQRLHVRGIVASRSDSTRTIDVAVSVTRGSEVVVSGRARVRVVE